MILVFLKGLKISVATVSNWYLCHIHTFFDPAIPKTTHTIIKMLMVQVLVHFLGRKRTQNWEQIILRRQSSNTALVNHNRLMTYFLAQSMG